MKAIILCAGKGERLMPLTENIPKPMVLIDNKPVLEYLIKLCKKHNITEIAINTSYFPEKIKEYFGNGEKFGVKLTYSFEQELLGTSGSLNNFKYFFNQEPFFVIYGDNITNLNLTEMLNYHKSKNAFATLYLYKENVIDDKTSIGCVVVDENNKIKEIIENPTEEDRIRLTNIPDERKLINTGVYILDPSILDFIPKEYSDFMKNIFPGLLNTKDFYGFQQDCYFKEVGQMQRYLQAKIALESGKVNLGL
tara:strand:+ start:1103 stop:1855 length:753 start_codon:yes stop_codon:yes gene_type:complete